MSSSVEYRVNHDGYLVVVSRRPKTVALQFAVPGILLGMPEGSPVLRLPWDDALVASAAPAAAGWWMSAWRLDGGYEAGVAVQVRGPLATDPVVADLEARTRTIWRRIDGILSTDHVAGRILPVDAEPGLWRWKHTEHAVLATTSALVRVLATQPELRPRLAEPDRMAALAHHLAVGAVGRWYPPEGLRRDRTDAYTALRQAGYVHRYDRPLAPGGLPPIDEVVDATRARLDANPYRRDRNPVERDWLEQTVRRGYYDVPPWPFEPLVR